MVPPTSSSWSTFDDGAGNTYYVNDVTGESAWELPPGSAATPQASSAGIAVETLTAGGHGIDAKEGADEWWGKDYNNSGYDDGQGYGDTFNPFGGGIYGSWPVSPAAGTQREGGKHDWGGQQPGDNGFALNSVPPGVGAGGEREGGGGGWRQQWDEGSQAYYWYHASTGESHW